MWSRLKAFPGFKRFKTEVNSLSESSLEKLQVGVVGIFQSLDTSLAPCLLLSLLIKGLAVTSDRHTSKCLVSCICITSIWLRKFFGKVVQSVAVAFPVGCAELSLFHQFAGGGCAVGGCY